MEIALDPSAFAAMIAHAKAARPREACGLLFGDAAMVRRAEPSRNVAADPERAFEIEPQALFAAQRGARAGWLGWYHSHPNGRMAPSAVDAAAAHEDGRLWLIVVDDAIAAFRARAGGAAHGRFDLVALRAV